MARTIPTVESSPKRYNDAVKQGRIALAQQGKANWTIGDLARKITTTYGDDTMSKFATDLDVPRGTLYDFRKVAEAYEPADRSPVNSWTVHQILSRETDRADLVTEAMTTAKARELIKSRQTDDSNVAGDGDGETDGETDGEETLDVQLQKAIANRDRLAGELTAAQAKVDKLTAEMNAQIQAASRNRRPRGSRRLAAA